MAVKTASAPSDSPRRRMLAADIRRLRQHRFFRAVVLEYCREISAGCVRWPLRKLLTQEFRYEICFRLIANHANWRLFGGEPPTLAAVKASARASARHVADFVASLRRMRLLTATSSPENRRILLLEPSATLIDEIGRHPRLMSDIYNRLRDGIPAAPAIPSPYRTVNLIIRATRASDGYGLSESPFPSVAAFAAHESGYMILTMVLQKFYGATAREGEPYLDLTYRNLALRFHVSQSHVANVLRGAREAGWFDIARGGHVRAMSADMVVEFEHFIAEQAAYFGWLEAGGPEAGR